MCCSRPGLRRMVRLTLDQRSRRNLRRHCPFKVGTTFALAQLPLIMGFVGEKVHNIEVLVKVVEPLDMWVAIASSVM